MRVTGSLVNVYGWRLCMDHFVCIYRGAMEYISSLYLLHLYIFYHPRTINTHSSKPTAECMILQNCNTPDLRIPCSTYSAPIALCIVASNASISSNPHRKIKFHSAETHITTHRNTCDLHPSRVSSSGIVFRFTVPLENPRKFGKVIPSMHVLCDRHGNG